MAFWFFFFLLFFSFYSKSCAELITALPGQPANVSFKQYSGNIVTDAKDGRALFYYFVEAQSPDPLSLPLTLWLNGGPGCSSLGFGAFMEHGPFQPGANGELIQNKYSWNLAEDNLRFIVNWLEEFPQYKNSEFFLTGESYAGHYIPQLAALIMEYNKQPNITAIKLKAIALGNPLLDADISVLGWRLLGCNDVFNRVADEVGADIDRSDLLLPLCTSSTSVQQFKPMGKHGKVHAAMARRTSAKGDPCLGDRIFAYLNKPEVQEALHANKTHLPFHWAFCGGPLFYQEDNFLINTIPLISGLIKQGIPIMLFSGDQDTKIPLTQTRIIANNLSKELKLLPYTTYGPWYDKKQVGGWSESFGAFSEGKNMTYLTFATVRGAAHEVPFTSPSQALTLFRSFLAGSPLPRPHN
ncbi:hypothetical protein Patl1_22144 [Pistacia atlantica]|uniref:Uncharacterized protein n=1 Tax=Pistacia atlantica TaxID=434234 RepID=A0ACC1BMK5_9ROSI|nr:hypothetical protein Patl1_22144 [Pistacia atlantica]